MRSTPSSWSSAGGWRRPGGSCSIPFARVASRRRWVRRAMLRTWSWPPSATTSGSSRRPQSPSTGSRGLPTPTHEPPRQARVSDVLSQHLADHLAAAEAMPALLPRVEEVAGVLVRAFERGGRLYTFGNGGSAADAQHLAGELIGRYKRERRPLPAVALSVDPSVLTCIANDYSFDEV